MRRAAGARRTLSARGDCLEIIKRRWTGRRVRLRGPAFQDKRAISAKGRCRSLTRVMNAATTEGPRLRIRHCDVAFVNLTAATSGRQGYVEGHYASGAVKSSGRDCRSGRTTYVRPKPKPRTRPIRCIHQQERRLGGGTQSGPPGVNTAGRTQEMLRAMRRTSSAPVAGICDGRRQGADRRRACRLPRQASRRRGVVAALQRDSGRFTAERAPMPQKAGLRDARRAGAVTGTASSAWTPDDSRRK